MIFNRLPELLCIAGSVITGFTILRYGFSVKKIKNELKVKIICISLAVSAVTGTAFCSMSYLQNLERPHPTDVGWGFYGLAPVKPR